MKKINYQIIREDNLLSRSALELIRGGNSATIHCTSNQCKSHQGKCKINQCTIHIGDCNQNKCNINCAMNFECGDFTCRTYTGKKI
ncbi:MAG: hypothetical protein NC328_01305 [Muribaculum sp.]|nr:hypothetical protein [Muribaculum sp.]